MPFANGDCLGPYQIVAPLGSGGMGDVYRARDTKLKRDVAVKVLPDVFAQDADRLARFQREAELLASLNHPNIAAVYGLEESQGVTAIVLELVEGETLAEIVARRAVPLADAVPIARQIADALEAAHEKGVVHRDLKPANIKITPAGTVKVLDFGLAKMLERDPASSSLSVSPTLSVHATYAGVILGTAAYMSPEQARGKPVDRRTDVWSFGCVLFEMLAGKQAFESGETVSDAIAAILTREPEWSTLPNDTPPHIRRLLRRCLQKDPRRRLRDIGDVSVEIDDGAAEPAASPPAAKSTLTRRSGFWLGTLVGVLLAAIGIMAAMFALRRTPPAAGPVVRLTIPPPENARFRIFGSATPHFAVSPDGTRVTYVVNSPDGPPRLWVRRLEALSGQPLAGTESAAFPFWSPDSRFIGFFTNPGNRLRKIDVSGGAPQTISEGMYSFGAAWNASGDIVVSRGAAGLVRTSADGSDRPVPVTTLDTSRGETAHRWPQFLPDGRHFLFHADSTQPENRAVYVGSLDSPRRALVMSSHQRAMFASGRLLFVREGALKAQPFDPATFRLSGEATTIADEVAYSGAVVAVSSSDAGVLAFTEGAPGIVTQLTWFDREGNRGESIGAPGDYSYVRLSPDRTRLAVARGGGDPAAPSSDIWILDLSRRGDATRVTFGPEDDRAPVWSPDGTRIVFASGLDLYVRPSGPAGTAEPVFKSSLTKIPHDWSSNGIVFTQIDPKTRQDICLLPLAGGKPSEMVRTPFMESAARLSPDAKWMAYLSDEGGRASPDVYVQSFPSGDRKRRISTTAGYDPQWSSDGKELFYLSNGGRLMAVDMTPGADLHPGVPRPLFRMNVPLSTRGGDYAVSADGRRFLVNESIQVTAPTPITVIVNWPALKK